MESKTTYRDALNSSLIYPLITNDQNNSTRSNNGVTMDNGRQFTYGMKLGIQDSSINIQTQNKSLKV